MTIDLDAPVELVVLTVMQKAARCRLPGTTQTITFRGASMWKLAPGMIATIAPSKQWIYGGNPYLSGDITSARIDPKALNLLPLKLVPHGIWDPAVDYWRETGEPLEDWEKQLLAWGPRPQFEMEQILPGFKPDDYDSDPIGRSNDLKEAGDFDGAYQMLMDCCVADLRCLDAHSHLGNIFFDSRPQDAIRNYEVGYRIGELALGENFDGLLPWGMIDNRPFLRCMHGYGLCLWRLKKFEAAAKIFERMLWLNPKDNQGARFCIEQARANTIWTPEEQD
jgi:tetratricopeptide (TPR) repeat protein